MNTPNNARATNPGDKTINCRDCKNDFVFSVGEQAFFAERGFSDPVRCKGCRDLRKAQKNPSMTSPTEVTAAPEDDHRPGKGGGGYGGGYGGKGGKRRRNQRDSWED